MVKIFNPIHGRDPLASMLDGLGKQLFGDSTANAIKQEQLYGLQRENTETENLMRRVGASGAQNLGSDPISQAIMIGSGYDPSKFGKIGLMGAATQFGARDPRTQNWQVGTGQSFDNTAEAFDLKLDETQRNNNLQSADRRYGVDQSVGENRRQFNEKPMPVITSGGAPGFVPQNELATTAVQPILSEAEQKGTLLGENFDDLPKLNPEQQQVLGARVDGTKAGTPRNYRAPDGAMHVTYDGVTNAQTGAPLPPGGALIGLEDTAAGAGLTNSTTSGLQQGQIAYDKFMATVGLAEPLTADPSLFGVQGAVRAKAQELIQGLGGAANLMGVREDLAKNLVSSETGQALGPDMAAQLIPELYDPRLGEVEALWGILLYQGASALAGQENRSVSDMDVQMMRSILGDPHSFFASNRSMASKLNVAKKLVDRGRGINQQYLGGGMPQGDAAPPPAQAPDAPSDGSVVIDGVKIRRVQ